MDNVGLSFVPCGSFTFPFTVTVCTPEDNMRRDSTLRGGGLPQDPDSDYTLPGEWVRTSVGHLLLPTDVPGRTVLQPVSRVLDFLSGVLSLSSLLSQVLPLLSGLRTRWLRTPTESDRRTPSSRHFLVPVSSVFTGMLSIDTR